METAPLIRAYDHAKASEHVFAAGEFANASRHTSSAEALRTLKLLEEHHRRIAELLKIAPEQSSNPDSESDANPDGADADASANADAASHDAKTSDPNAVVSSAAGGEGAAPRRGQPPQLTPSASSGTGGKPPALASSLAQKRMIPPQRDLTSSIASNLATARGIRSKQRGRALTPSVSNDQAPGNFDVPPRVTDLNSWPKPQIGDAADRRSGFGEGSSEKNSAEAAAAEQPAQPEEGYSRFYNAFGTILGRISAPLAFAGLPLISEESTLSQADSDSSSVAPRRHKLTRTHSAAAEPELSKIYSKATMRALSRDMAPADSFYVVPTSGHTVSYANILSFAEKEKRRMEASSIRGEDDDADDDFVDARETLTNPLLSNGAKKRVGRSRSERDLNNTIEELYLENKSLKDALDNLSKRLHAFEASAQNSHMALAESMRLMRPGSPVSTGSGGGRIGDDGGGLLLKKVQELEEQLALALKDNEKKQKTLNKYREKWEMLKAGAKARRGAQSATENTEG